MANLYADQNEKLLSIQHLPPTHYEEKAICQSYGWYTHMKDKKVLELLFRIGRE